MKKVTFLFIFFLSVVSYSQVTTSGISGTVKSNSGERLVGASVEAIHQPTGTKYFATTDGKGGFSIPAIKPGGPYVVKVTYVGFKRTEITDINAPLGNDVNLNVVAESESSELKEVVVNKTNSNSIISKDKSGASQQFSNRQINSIPVLGSRSINSITKYNANAGAGGSFGGQDSRLNNFTIDGSVFNNGFGLGNDAQAGGRTGSTAISLDAIDQLQVNVAPFDVRQSGFTGSGINAVTRSGTNEFEGSVYNSFRNNGKNYVGTRAGDVTIKPSNFSEKIWGARFGAPIIKNKLFFFGNFENVDGVKPAHTWTSTGSAQPSGQISAPTFAQLQDLSDFVQQKLNYTTGPWENYDAVNTSRKYLVRLDWNINDNNKLSVRYVHHDSSADQVISNSYVGNSLGNRIGVNALAYKNSGYVIQDNTRSAVVELNSKLSEKWHNNFIGGYDKQLENRGLQGTLFPTIDIKSSAASTNDFITLGLDPFTQGNKLDYSTLHFTDNITGFFGKHTLVFGANFENFKSNNSFFPGSNGAYTFNSIAEFKAAVNESVANNFKPTTTNLPAAFQFRYSALPGNAEPLQILKTTKVDAYAQDNIKVSDKLKVTVGIRASRVSFENTALENPVVNALTFAGGEKLSTGTIAKTQILLEPRVGFNLDLKGDASTLIRGGSGIFTGRPPFVFLSNAIGNNGVLTGFIDARNTGAITTGNGTIPYGFTPNPGQYFTPATATLPTTLDLAFTDRNFKFPQVWKTDLAVDQKLPFGFVGTIEGIYSQNLNAINYRNANLDVPVAASTFIGADQRPIYARTDNGVRVNDNVSNAIVLDNTNKGYFYSATFKLEYPYKNGIWGSIAYTHSGAYDLLSAGSVAASSWTAARSVNGNNDLPLTASNNNTPNRLVGIIGYKIKYGGTYGGATSINLGYIGEQTGTFSYAYSGDLNGDRVSNNDLLYVPNTSTETRFQPLTVVSKGVTTVYTELQQQQAFDAYINQDKYLSTRRGQYVERNGAILPILHKIDLSITQDFFIKIKGKNNSFQFRADILNFTNLINKDWGVSQRATNSNVLNFRTVTANVPYFQLATQTDASGNAFLIKDTFQKNASVFDVWQAQFTLRYIFGK
ncbi:TonB-dependent receptor [Flavobacterium soyangense]|uniref:Carboxypeptidase regulatory-like domain-containing protein n=1 Tax=Flavobacterium soyangense TaxID=2023265 RepID=A0A930XY25_9FLAO|nr:carboxypeptidase-like regulatory domain-containing protein [Flavobacterium soyangense]MBF2707388.1 carboxypeptidase regulatory-like domain-containing protein [Flavobacterium soyangense]